MKEVKLVKLSDTGWTCRHASFKAVKTTFTAILHTLEQLWDHTGSRAIEARGLYHQISSFPFLLSLLLFDEVFSITGKLSNLLLSEQLHYATAATCMATTKTSLMSMRSKSEWLTKWDSAAQLADSNNIPVTLPRQSNRITPSSFSDFVIEGITGIRPDISEYRTSVYYSTIDVLGELNSRFTETNLSLLHSLQSLASSFPSFLHVPSLLPFLNHYNTDVDSVTSEAAVAVNFRKEASPLTYIHIVYAHLHGAQDVL
uniref:Uncharacterized protein n=1 Tax=Amphimedon queenslandica TaxID=400682 RepID=A0A1X7UJX0_AMPQE